MTGGQVLGLVVGIVGMATALAIIGMDRTFKAGRRAGRRDVLGEVFHRPLGPTDPAGGQPYQEPELSQVVQLRVLEETRRDSNREMFAAVARAQGVAAGHARSVAEDAMARFGHREVSVQQAAEIVAWIEEEAERS